MLISELHNDLILDILLRVPVKSLILFKSVSKSWRSLISSSFFATLHHKRTSKKIIVSMSPYDVAFLDCHQSTFTFRCSPLYRTPRFSSPVFRDPFHVVGSSNGLICVCSGMGKLLWVWNPSTRESIEIVPHLKYSFVNRLGFGYDESGDDYKIVIATSRYRHSNAVDSGISIYSSKTGTWRHLADTEGLNLCPNGPLSGTLLNGALHWRLEPKEAKIITFDLAEEMFRVFLPPPVRNSYRGRLGVLNEMLCFSDIFYNSAQRTFDHCIWAMKEYGVETSWTKLFTIGSCGNPTHYLYQCLPLCSTECGEIFYMGLGVHMCLVLFNPEKETFLPLDCSYRSEATVYVETLVSPKVLRAKEKKYDLSQKDEL